MFWKRRPVTARWSIISTMHGVPEAVLPCIAHHLNSDAERIHIYLDDHFPEIEAALATNSRCVVTVCDDAYWASRPAGRPLGVARRQIANLAHAREHSDSDWLVHIDSDEFLVATDPTAPLALGAELARVPREHDWVRILPMERVLPPTPEPQTIFDGVFRSPTNDAALIAAAYGEVAKFLFCGMSGHVRGKVGFRSTTRLRVRLHDVIFPLPPGVEAPIFVKPSELPNFLVLLNTRLLHFESWTPLQWASKLLRFAERSNFDGHHPGRQASIRFMADHPESNDRLGLFERVQRLTPEALALLAKAGLLRQVPFDPSALTRETFPSVAMDFRLLAFEARLRASNPDYRRRNGL